MIMIISNDEQWMNNDDDINEMIKESNDDNEMNSIIN